MAPTRWLFSGIRNLQVKNFLFYAVFFLSLFFIFLYFGVVLKQKTLSGFFLVCSALADASIFTFIASIFTRRWKVLALPIPFLISLLIIVNLLYYRNFFDLIPPSLYQVSHVEEPLILRSGLNSLKLSDIFLPLFSLCPSFYFLIFKDSIIEIKNKEVRIIFLFLMLMFESITIGGSFRRQKIFNNPKNITEHINYVYPSFFTNWMFWYSNHNFTGYLIKVVSEGKNKKKDLSEKDIEIIQDYFKSISLMENESYEEIKIQGKPVNLIFIVVESLPYKIIELNDSIITPNLYSLAHNPDIFVAKCKVLANYGRSSDAQFIYNTGLLPLRTEPLVSRYSHNDYPSLAKAIDVYAMEVIGERGDLWSHNITTKSFGFSRLVSDIASNVENQDSIIFQKAFEEFSKQKAPSYIFITSLSMHDPYMVKAVSNEQELAYPENFSDQRDKEYLNRLHHFDDYLGQFINKLKEINKYDDSLIIIVGDHDINKEEISSELWDSYVPMLVINSSKPLYDNQQVSQLDIFPTVLDLMDVKYKFLGTDYKGLGNSLTQKTSPRPISDRDYEISEMIIKSKLPSKEEKHISREPL